MGDRVVHFEIPSDNPEKSMAFFKNVFDWNFQGYENGEYWIAITGDEKTPGINGAVMKKRDPKQPLVNSISVQNIDSSIQKIEKAGGKIVVPKAVIPGIGWSAYFTDPDGNIHGVYQEDPSAK